MENHSIYVNQEQIGKALVTLATQKALVDIGKPTYDKVVEMLYSKYHCYMSDCYEHPEYLSAVLKNLFGNSHVDIVNSIKKQLEEFSNKKPIGRFIEILS